MLTNTPTRISIPVADMARARHFYAETLGQTILTEHEFATIFESAGTQIAITASPDAGKATYSLVTWLVDDIDARMADLRQAGIQFEEYAFVDMENGKAKLGQDVVAWFKDTEGNLLAIAQLDQRP
jgi:extradiol dioxygenase family protein